MIDAHRGRLAEPGKERFDTGTEAGEVMRANAAGRDDQIGVDQAAMHAHRRSARRSCQARRSLLWPS